MILLVSKILLDTDLKIILLENNEFKNNEQWLQKMLLF